MKKTWTILLALMIACTSIACFAEPSAELPLTGKKILVSTFFLEDDYCIEMNNTIVNRLEELGAEVSLTNSNSDGEVQTRQIEAHLESGIDFLFLMPPSQDVLVPVIEKAADMGVMTILYDAGANTTKGVITHVSANDRFEGNTVGTYLVDYITTNLDGKATILFEYAMEQERFQMRVDGVTEILDAHPELDVEYVYLDSKGLREVAANVTANYAAPYDLIVGAEMNTSWGAISTLEAQNTQDVKVLSIADWSKEGFEAIRDGHKYYLTFCTVSPYEIGNTAVDSLLAYLDGEELEDVIYVNTPMVSTENMHEFWDFEKFL